MRMGKTRETCYGVGMCACECGLRRIWRGYIKGDDLDVVITLMN